MVNSMEVPKRFGTSPGSYSGTPHLIINRDATKDLDSSNAFEGTDYTILESDSELLTIPRT
jgi:S-adenosylmethionine decarboxylase